MRLWDVSGHATGDKTNYFKPKFKLSLEKREVVRTEIVCLFCLQK